MSTSTSDYETTPTSSLPLPKKLIIQRKSPTLSYSSDETIPDPDILKSLLSSSRDNNKTPPLKLRYDPSINSQENDISSTEENKISPLVIRKRPVKLNSEPLSVPNEQTLSVPEEPVSIPEEQTLSLPDEPVSVPDEQTLSLSEEPVSVPEEPVSIPDEQTLSVPEEQTLSSVPEEQTLSSVPDEQTLSLFEEQTLSVPDEPVSLSEEPVSVPDEPVSVPEEPVSVPEEPVSLPEEPVSLPEEPVSVPDEQTLSVPEEPVSDKQDLSVEYKEESISSTIYNIYDKLTNDQLDMVSVSRNILQNLVNKREKKLELLINDSRRETIEQKILNTIDIGLLNIGELLFLAANRNIYMDKITKQYFRQRILVVLIYLAEIYPDWEFRSYTCDVPETSNLRCDELINVLSYEEALFILTFFNINDENIDSIISILDEKEIYNVIKTATFPKLSSNIINRIKRYSILKTIPQRYLIPLSFNIIPSDLTMGDNYDHIIRLLIKTPSNQAEDLFAIKRDWNTVNVRNEFGILPPNDYISIDYMATNIQDYPKKKSMRDFNISRLEFIDEYNDIEIYNQTKILPAYSSRIEFIQNTRTYLEGIDNIYFIVSGSNLIYFGNKKQSNKYSLDSLRRILSLVKPNTVTNQPQLRKELRDIQKLLISHNLINNSINKSLVNAIMVTEGRINGANQLFSFNELGTYNIGLVRRGLIQMFYYSRTNNPIYKPFIGESIIISFTNESSYKDMINKNKLHDMLYFSIFYLDLFFCFQSTNV